ncbi:MAG TPA: type II secretion system protein GspL [Gammaproteobacteria bacterium]|nr:type II secretion system protein GspL [Gammaproteobacteria bacterium]
MEYLILRLEEHAASGRWAVFDADGRLVSQAARGALSEAAEAARGRRLIALVPGLEVVATETALPSASPARLRKMLPYSLEDALAEDVDRIFFAVGARRPSGAVPVAMVSRRQLEDWLAALSAAGLVPQAVYSDSEGVPDTPGTLTLVIEGERVYGRAPDRPPFVFEGLGLGAILDALEAEETELSSCHAVIYLDSEAQHGYAQDLRDLRARIESTDVKLAADGAWCRLAATLTQRPGINLLQGNYAPKSNWGELWRPWRFAAALLLAAALFGLLARGAELLALRHEDRALTAQLSRECTRAIGAAQLDECEAEVRRRLGSRGAAGDSGRGFLAAVAAVAASKQPHGRIEALSYRDAVMDLQLVVPDVSALNTFVQDLEHSKRFTVQIQSTNPVQDGVEGRVRVAGATP